MRKRLPTFLIFLLSCCYNSNHQTEQLVTLPNTQVKYLYSKNVDIRYKLYISLPKDYNNNNLNKYPVVYLLDADYSFALAHNIVEHLADRENIPNVILVGIAYDGEDAYKLHRTRDYTPIYSSKGGYGKEYQKYSGRGLRFKNFLIQELIPYIEQSYKVNQNRTIVGHSYGGLFGSWVLLTDTNLFSNYILVSPSLWYGDRYIFSVLEKAKNLKLNANIYLGIGSLENCGNYRMVNDIELFSSKLKKNALNLKLEIFEDDNHNSVFPAALSRGIIYTQTQKKEQFLNKFKNCN